MSGQVIVPTGFSATAHAKGPLIAVLEGSRVAINLRLDPQTTWALSHALAEAQRAQAVFETRVAKIERLARDG